MKYYNVFSVKKVRDQLIANTVLVAFAFLMLLLRFVSRKMRNARIWYDDACIVGSLVFTIGMLAMQYEYAHVGMGYHMLDIPPENTVYIFKMLVAYQMVYYMAIVLAKIGYLLFYLRIFEIRPFRIAAMVCMGCACAYWLGSMLQVFLLCRPFAANWDPSIPGAYCASRNVSFSTIGAFNLITDLMIVLLPLHFIYKLHMTMAIKLGLTAIFSVGLFISAISIIRIRVLTTINYADTPYYMTWAAFWSVTEPALAVSNACVPMIRPILRPLFPGLFSSRGQYGSSKKPTTRTKNSSRKFERVTDGDYPLTRPDKGITTIDVMVGSSHDNEDDDNGSYSMNSRDHHSPPREAFLTGGINITNEWSVSHQRSYAA